MQPSALLVTQRGSNYHDVFRREADCQFYLLALERQARRFELDILAYCLMPNHVHLLAVPARSESLALTICQTNRIYADYAVRSHISDLNPWQDRFFSGPVSRHFVPAALRYVECNPVRAGLARQPEAWPWSSAGAHLGCCAWPALLDWERWSAEWDAERWQRLLGEEREIYIETLLRRAVYQGCAMGQSTMAPPLAQWMGLM